MARNSVLIGKVMFNRIPAIARALSTDSNKLVQKTALDVQAEIATSMEGARHGRRYGGHVASAPGEKPARDMGTLAGSLGVKSSYNHATVFVSAAHGPHLEYGTRFMAPRPYLRPAARKFNVIFQFAMQAMVDRAMRK